MGCLARAASTRSHSSPPAHGLRGTALTSAALLQIRPLASGDYARGHLDVLRALTSVPDVGEAAWEARFAEMHGAQPRAYYPLVLVEQAGARIVATGTLFLERKFIRALGAAGHIEDIAVDKSQQGKGLGRIIIAALTAVSEAVGAYKTILDCSEENQRE